MKNKLGAILRGVLIVLMSATTVMTLLGAVGTACIAWNADKYGAAFAFYVPYMPTYQTFVYIKLVVALVGTMVTYALLRGDRWFYVGALATLLAGLGAAATQMYYTSTLKGVSFFAVAPTNIRFYITAVTLIAFLIIRIPGIWNKSGLGNPTSQPGSPMAAGGAALIVAGALIVTTPLWVGETHMLDGYNLVYTLELPLLIDGIAMLLAGAAMVFGRRVLALVRAKQSSVVSIQSVSYTHLTLPTIYSV